MNKIIVLGLIFTAVTNASPLFAFGKSQSKKPHHQPLSENTQNYLDDSPEKVFSFKNNLPELNCVYKYGSIKKSLTCDRHDCKENQGNSENEGSVGSSWKCGEKYLCIIWEKDQKQKAYLQPKTECTFQERQIISAPNRNPCQAGYQVARDGSCRKSV